jgi:uncharacterized membrane protein
LKVNSYIKELCLNREVTFLPVFTPRLQKKQYCSAQTSTHLFLIAFISNCGFTMMHQFLSATCLNKEREDALAASRNCILHALSILGSSLPSCPHILSLHARAALNQWSSQPALKQMTYILLYRCYRHLLLGTPWEIKTWKHQGQWPVWGQVTIS